MSKFKVGDVVECIGDSVTGKFKGAGWQSGLVFKINRIERDICFGGKRGNGVYEEDLELVNKYKVGDILTSHLHWNLEVVAVKNEYLVTKDTDDENLSAWTVDELDKSEWKLPNDVKEMTLAEVSRELGYDVKIVKGS